jgi:hypothetical protein
LADYLNRQGGDTVISADITEGTASDGLCISLAVPSQLQSPATLGVTALELMSSGVVSKKAVKSKTLTASAAV